MDKRTAGEILLVGEHEQKALFHLPIREDAVQFLLGFVNTFPIL
jgi:hypothetical protein